MRDGRESQDSVAAGPNDPQCVINTTGGFRASKDVSYRVLQLREHFPTKVMVFLLLTIIRKSVLFHSQLNWLLCVNARTARGDSGSSGPE